MTVLPHHSNGRTSNRVTDLTTLNPLDWQQVKLEISMDRGWFPNRVFLHRKTKEIVINSQRSGEDKDWALNWKVFNDVITAERNREIPQAYLRLTNYNGQFVAQETAQNVWRRLKNAPINTGPHGEYCWVDETFNAHLPGNPKDQPLPF